MSSKNYFGPIKFWIYTFSYVKLYFNHDSGVILPKKMSLLTKNWPKWSKIAIFVIFWRFFGDNIPKFSKFSKKDIIFSFLTQFYVLKDSIYNYFRKQVFGYLGSIEITHYPEQVYGWNFKIWRKKWNVPTFYWDRKSYYANCTPKSWRETRKIRPPEKSK